MSGREVEARGEAGAGNEMDRGTGSRPVRPRPQFWCSVGGCSARSIHWHCACGRGIALPDLHCLCGRTFEMRPGRPRRACEECGEPIESENWRARYCDHDSWNRNEQRQPEQPIHEANSYPVGKANSFPVENLIEKSNRRTG